ncbi:hypothetical protein EK0264_01450 [Epidermidibacterium keratini]|uniref:Ankyrin repeat domain-containing protein n=1 Tax=Epidermidibacterium keratini TaxID=1891644 RepID=A0A7L4YJ02_9ACTN|nr:ankyrin repeat domain-containing protein [Epidermidibacterium keratini]QHB99087.1 hypothetical protein EK0264_01450 [Epidermidibacterium keratini]
MTDPQESILPPLDDGDIYIYAHSNGGISLIRSGGDLRAVTLAGALLAARATHESGDRVFVGGDNAPLSIDVIQVLRSLGWPLELFGAPARPQHWPGGKTAVMTATEAGAEDILDDLIARGADVHRADSMGSTALHHAAAAGNSAAVDALIAAGARVDLPNGKGATPLHIASTLGHREAAERLRYHGAYEPSAPLHSTSTTTSSSDKLFSRMHFLVLYVWLVPLIVAALVLILAWPPEVQDSVAITMLLLLPWIAVAPPLAFWRGGVPRRIDGSALMLRTLIGRRRVVDLDQVTFIAAGGSPHRRRRNTGGWLLLGLAEGASISRRSLRRLFIPDGDRDAVAAAVDRAVVVVLHGPNREEVLLPIATIAARRGTRVTPTVRRLFAASGRGSG